MGRKGFGIGRDDASIPSRKRNRPRHPSRLTKPEDCSEDWLRRSVHPCHAPHIELICHQKTMASCSKVAAVKLAKCSHLLCSGNKRRIRACWRPQPQSVPSCPSRASYVGLIRFRSVGHVSGLSVATTTSSRCESPELAVSALPSVEIYSTG
jgi:hypothetical protein